MRRFQLSFLSAILLSAIMWTGPAQAMRGSFARLSCEHLSQIERSFLSYHISYKQPSKDLETKTVDQYLQKLDPAKIYLLKSDVAKIKKGLNGLFKKTAKNDCSVILNAQKVLIKRMEERVNFVKAHLNNKFKFKPKTKVNLDPDDRKFAKSKVQANRFHKQYLQFQISNYLATDVELKEAREKVIRSYERILRRAKDKDSEDVWSAYLDAFARALDPHSSYLSREQLEDFQIQMALSLEGIGATLSSRDGFTVIEQLIAGGAAFRSGKLRPKDKITAVAQGNKGEYTNVVEQDLKDVVRLIRGPKGTKVRLKILRKKGKKSAKFDVTLVRDKINLEDEAASMTYIDRKINGKDKKIGLLNLPSFYADSKSGGRSAAKDMKRLLKEARRKKVDGVVLDFSTNGGGSLDDAVKIAGLFFRIGNVVKQSQRQTGRRELELADVDAAVDYAGPLVVLTSRISASASEIVAGTLKDYRRAVIVGGDHTFGKGSVQSVQPLKGGAFGALKTTVGMFFTPGGHSTQHRGVDADVVLPSVYSTEEIGEKTLDYSLPPQKIPAFLSAEAYVASGPSEWKMVRGPVLDQLAKKSAKRVAKSKDFIDLKKDIKKAAKRGKTIVVGDILKEQEEDKAEKKKKGEDKDDGHIPTAAEKLEKYLKRADIQEAINVAADLIEAEAKPAITVGKKDKTSKTGQQSREVNN